MQGLQSPVVSGERWSSFLGGGAYPPLHPVSRFKSHVSVRILHGVHSLISLKSAKERFRPFRIPDAHVPIDWDGGIKRLDV